MVLIERDYLLDHPTTVNRIRKGTWSILKDALGEYQMPNFRRLAKPRRPNLYVFCNVTLHERTRKYI